MGGMRSSRFAKSLNEVIARKGIETMYKQKLVAIDPKRRRASYGKPILAELDYDLKPTPSFPFDLTKERWSMYQLKRYRPSCALLAGNDEGPRSSSLAAASGISKTTKERR